MTARSLVFGRSQRAHALIALLWRVTRWRAVALGLLALGLGTLPPLTVLAVGRLVAAIPAAVRYGLSAPQGVNALLALALVAAGFVLTGLGETASRYLGTELGIRYVTGTWDLLAGAAQELRGISELEDPDVVATVGMLDELDRREVQRSAPAALGTLITARTQGLGAAALLFGFRWWAPFILYAGWSVASVTGARWFASSLGRAVQAGSEGLCRAEYLRQLGMGAGFAKEARIFGLGGWIRGEYAGHWQESMAGVWRGRRRGFVEIAVGVAIVVLCVGAVFGAMAWSDLTVASFTVYALAILRTESLGFVGVEQRVGQATALAPQILSLYGRLRSGVRTPAARPSGGSGPVAVQIRGLNFRYQQPVLRGLELDIPAGQALAVVGANGAGKSTLIKLICGLYVPQSGAIRLDGCADPAALRHRIAAILQDFVRYELPLRDNVDLRGATGDDVLADVGATELFDRLPAGWDTVLASGYAGGVDLSGGQWQRVALARAMAAVRGGAGLLILDEPTASLDIRAEAELFDRFLELTRDITTILVSHRLSTVRRADRIVVLAGGRIVEDGSHDELMVVDGLYAHMFRLQAARFTSDGAR